MDALRESERTHCFQWLWLGCFVRGTKEERWTAQNNWMNQYQAPKDLVDWLAEIEADIRRLESDKVELDITPIKLTKEEEEEWLRRTEEYEELKWKAHLNPFGKRREEGHDE
jgi:hypothetical protein